MILGDLLYLFVCKIILFSKDDPRYNIFLLLLHFNIWLYQFMVIKNFDQKEGRLVSDMYFFLVRYSE